VSTAHHGLAIDRDRAYRKRSQRLDDARIAVRPVEPATSVEPYPIVAAPGDQAVSVVFDLVHPRRAALAALGGNREARGDEAWREGDAKGNTVGLLCATCGDQSGRTSAPIAADRAHCAGLRSSGPIVDPNCKAGNTSLR
jgi:hypothetical protein